MGTCKFSGRGRYKSFLVSERDKRIMRALKLAWGESSESMVVKRCLEICYGIAVGYEDDPELEELLERDSRRKKK
jgi:hypothetical protein